MWTTKDWAAFAVNLRLKVKALLRAIAREGFRAYLKGLAGLLLVSLIPLSSTAEARICEDLEATWWLSSSTKNDWVKKEIVSNRDCDHVTVITTQKEPHRPESRVVQKYDVHDEWQLKDRYQTKPIGGWRSLFGRVFWDEAQLTLHGRLIREEDEAVIWDIQHSMTRVGDELYDRNLILFPQRDKVETIELIYVKDSPQI